jgi:hypothetical protein
MTSNLAPLPRERVRSLTQIRLQLGSTPVRETLLKFHNIMARLRSYLTNVRCVYQASNVGCVYQASNLRPYQT